MELRSLLLCKDERAIRILSSLLTERNIKVEVCDDLRSAQELLWSQKFDGVFADCELPSAPELLRSVHKSKHNKRSIAFAMIEVETRLGMAFSSGAHFVLHKPLSVEKSKRTLRAAHGLMMREQRVYFRHSAASLVSGKVAGGSEMQASLVDLTQAGALIAFPLVLRRGQDLELRFFIPETRIQLGIGAKVIWSDISGRAGVRFETLSEYSNRALAEWSKLRSVEEMPVGTIVIPQIRVEYAPDREPEPPVAPKLGRNQSRAQVRGSHYAPIKVATFRHGRPIVVYGVCLNINENGLGAELEDDLLIGDHVLIEVRLPGRGQTCVLHGEIRHRNGRRYGFELMALPKRSLN